MTLPELDEILERPETRTLEFKEARNQFSHEEACRYCSAIANEGGGFLILGVSNHRPRRVVGSGAFREPGNEEFRIRESLGNARVLIDELRHRDGRVLVMTVEGHPPGELVLWNGIAYARAGESVVPMNASQMKRILLENETDFSATRCVGARLDDLDDGAVEAFRRGLSRRSGNRNPSSAPRSQFLEDMDLLVEGVPTVAAMVLFGGERALSRVLPQAEVIFEYRLDEGSIDSAERHEWRKGLLLWLDELWGFVEKRNDLVPIQSGFVRHGTRRLNDVVVREAVINAVSHRDYRKQGSIFIRHFPQRLEVESPGGFPQGVDSTNVVLKQVPRNRLLATSLERCEFAERSGQGVDRMLRECLLDGKPSPDFSRSDAHAVVVSVRGAPQEGRFARFMAQLGDERLRAIDPGQLMVLDCLRSRVQVPARLDSCLPGLVEMGVVVPGGRGRGPRFILNPELYVHSRLPSPHRDMVGPAKGSYLPRLAQHLLDQAGTDGLSLRDLARVVPGLSRGQVQRLLSELKKSGKAHVLGRTKASRWFPGPGLAVRDEEEPGVSGA